MADVEGCEAFVFGEHEGNDVPEEFAEDESVELVAWEKSWGGFPFDAYAAGSVLEVDFFRGDVQHSCGF